MERNEDGPVDGPEQAANAGSIDLSQVDDEVSVLVRNRAPSKTSTEKPGSRLAAFLRATKPSSTPKQWPPRRSEPKPKPKPEAKSAPEPPQPAVAVRSQIEQAPAKVWPPVRETKPEPSTPPEETSADPKADAPVSDYAEPKADAPAPNFAETQADAPVSNYAEPKADAPAPSFAETQADAPSENPGRFADSSPASNDVGPDAAPERRSPKLADSATQNKSPSLADYVPPGMRKPVETGSPSAPSWPPPREPDGEAPSPKALPDDIPEDLPALARGPIKSANQSSPSPKAPAAPSSSKPFEFAAFTTQLAKPFAALRDRASAWSQRRAAKAEQLGSGFPVLPESSTTEDPPEETQSKARGNHRKSVEAPSRTPAPSVRTYPAVPPAKGPETSPVPSPTQSQAPQVASPPFPQPVPSGPSPLPPPEPARVPAAFVRTKPSVPNPSDIPEAPAPFVKTKAPVDSQDSGLGTFKRRQTPQQPRRRKQHSYRHTAPDSTLGLRWWFHHWSGVTWLGRSLWAGAFICAWIALSRCLDPAVSDPKLSQVPYLALLGWLLCAALAFNQRIPSRFRWTGLVLGAANSIALALSWSFRLHQL